MALYECALLLLYTSLSTASFDSHPRGWLDNVVEFHKNKLFEDFRMIPDVEIKATIQPAPRGYVDSSAWNTNSVSRLLLLIRESKKALTVRRFVRKMLRNTRRKMTFKDSFKAFPSLSKDSPNDLYYDSYSGEMYSDMVTTEDGFIEDKDNDVIIVSNPVEARLPSAMISINLLRKILEERAIAGRYMSTTRKTIPWKLMTSHTSSATPAQNTMEEGGATITGNLEEHTGNTAGTGAATNVVATTAAAS